MCICLYLTCHFYFFFLFAFAAATITTIHIMLHIDAFFACIVINVRTNLLFIDCWWISIDILSTFLFSITNVNGSQQVSSIYNIDKKHYLLDLWNEAYIYMYIYLTHTRVCIDCIIEHYERKRAFRLMFLLLNSFICSLL